MHEGGNATLDVRYWLSDFDDQHWALPLPKEILGIAGFTTKEAINLMVLTELALSQLHMFTTAMDIFIRRHKQTSIVQRPPSTFQPVRSNAIFFCHTCLHAEMPTFAPC